MAYARWRVVHKRDNDRIYTPEEIVDFLLKVRGVLDIEQFLSPHISHINAIPKVILGSLDTIIERVHRAIKNKERIVIYGDYDVDGVTATAILWEALSQKGATVFPYIPHRVDEGYGLSKGALEEIRKEGTTLVITCDTGITGKEEIAHAAAIGLDVIVTDHHILPPELPGKAVGIIHELGIAGAAVAWKLAYALGYREGLDLVCLGTVADVMPLTGENRVFVSYGLRALQTTERKGLLALYRESGIQAAEIGTYEVGHIIDPRLNAAGRLEHAMDSLRLLLTRNEERAGELARHLSETNATRQRVTKETFEDARILASSLNGKIIVVGQEGWNQGVIGLVAGKLVEEFYKPSLVVSLDETSAKGSARSVSGFNVTEAIGSASHLLTHYGGHPMAAGFSLKRSDFETFVTTMGEYAYERITDEMLSRELVVDMALGLNEISHGLFRSLSVMSPFGVGNTQPLFVTEGLIVDDIRTVGAEGKHLKLVLSGFEGIGFGLGSRASELHAGDRIDVAYTLNNNVWNGRERLQFKIRDLRVKE